MSGHNKWTKIKHKKGTKDKKRGQVFTKLIHEIKVAVRENGIDKNKNAKLRTAIANALDNNMAKDTIERAIKSYDQKQNNNLTVNYEGYGPSGTAFIIECTTNNRNRTVAKIRSIFTKYHCKLSTNGSVSFMFTKKGIIKLKRESVEENLIIEVALKAGAQDIISQNENILIEGKFDTTFQICQSLEKKGIPVLDMKFIREPNTKIKVSDLETLNKFKNMKQELENLDDVEKIFDNVL